MSVLAAFLSAKVIEGLALVVLIPIFIVILMVVLIHNHFKEKRLKKLSDASYEATVKYFDAIGKVDQETLERLGKEEARAQRAYLRELYPKYF